MKKNLNEIFDGVTPEELDKLSVELNAEKLPDEVTSSIKEKTYAKADIKAAAKVKRGSRVPSAVWIRVGALAACFALIVGAIVLLPSLRADEPSDSIAPDDSGAIIQPDVMDHSDNNTAQSKPGENILGAPIHTASPGLTEDTRTDADYTWTEDIANTEVYVLIESTSIRSEPNTRNGSFVSLAFFEESYKRIKYCDTWTLIDYNGNECYVATAHVTTNPSDVKFTCDAEETTVYAAIDELPLRSDTIINWYGHIMDNNIELFLEKGYSLTRVATSENGEWIKVRVTYEELGFIDQILYCRVEHISATPPN